ncbi:thrombomodulin-like [Myxocyprinus asiaticus]|uniref:thrombomodulin-like n=1 Tax=Myxocyprinus asiaticus TaxID=70543 RepID=UPI002222DF95|nr:thrombomodulin-like [Myxocyprinus asiaticus]
MSGIIGIAMALVILSVHGEITNNGHCTGGSCFTIHTDKANFAAAQQVCESKGGHLMTVRKDTTSDILADLLNAVPGDFWLGLRYAGDRCSNSTLGLKGYKWITGHNTTQYINWKSNQMVCSPQCVSVSKNVLKWNERHCREEIDGYLCEYKNADYCDPLSSSQPVLYETLLGFRTDGKLKEVPDGTNGTILPFGTRFICLSGTWIAAPWNCEVFGGGCAYKCIKNEQISTCTCPKGYKIEDNNVTCTKKYDPCLLAECEHDCSRVGNTSVCICRQGFELDADKKTCKDINDCIDESVCQGQNEECVNTKGSFECRCKLGFERVNGFCVDVDECSMSGSVKCDHQCVNDEGSYHCECFEGYIQSAKDTGECIKNCSFKCPADCDINTSAQCACPDGFLLEDEQFCVDIDECDNGDCDQECKNTAGGFECFCRDGFELIDELNCVRKDFGGLDTSSTFDMFIPTSRSPTDQPVLLSAGILLAIMICTVMSVLILVCLTYYILRRRNKMHHYDVYKGQCDVSGFQQVIIEKNSAELSFPSRYLKQDT